MTIMRIALLLSVASLLVCIEARPADVDEAEKDIAKANDATLGRDALELTEEQQEQILNDLDIGQVEKLLSIIPNEILVTGFKEFDDDRKRTLLEGVGGSTNGDLAENLANLSPSDRAKVIKSGFTKAENVKFVKSFKGSEIGELIKHLTPEYLKEFFADLSDDEVNEIEQDEATVIDDIAADIQKVDSTELGNYADALPLEQKEKLLKELNADQLVKLYPFLTPDALLNAFKALGDDVTQQSFPNACPFYPYPSGPSGPSAPDTSNPPDSFPSGPSGPDAPDGTNPTTLPSPPTGPSAPKPTCVPLATILASMSLPDIAKVIIALTPGEKVIFVKSFGNELIGELIKQLPLDILKEFLGSLTPDQIASLDKYVTPPPTIPPPTIPPPTIPPPTIPPPTIPPSPGIYIPDPFKGTSKSQGRPGNRDHISGVINAAENILGLGDQSTHGFEALKKVFTELLKVFNIGHTPKFPPKSDQ